MYNLVLLPVILPLFSVAIAFFVGLVQKSKSNSLNFSLFAFSIAFVNLLASIFLFKTSLSEIILYNVGGWQSPIGIQLVVDKISATMLVLVNLIASYVFIAGYELNNKENFDTIIGSLWLIVLAGINGICISGDLFNIFVFLEVASIAIYLLVSLGGKENSYESAFNYLIIGSIGTTFFVLGIGIVYLLVGSLNIIDISNVLSKVFNLDENISHHDEIKNLLALPSGNKILYLGIVFMVLGISVKAAIMPLGMWLVDVYQNSSNTFTAFLSGTATKVCLYILIRLYKAFSFCIFFDYSVGYNLADLLPVFLSIMAVIVSYYTLFEDDLKRILSFSSLSQILYIAIAISLFSQAGTDAALIHIFNHSIFKSPLFMLAGIWIYVFNCSSIKSLHGSGQLVPFSCLLFLLLSMSVVGIPGTAGFVSKWYLLSAAWNHKLMILIVPLILISSFLSLLYISKLIIDLWFVSSDDSGSELPVKKIKIINDFPKFSFAITLLFSFVSIILGWYFPL